MKPFLNGGAFPSPKIVGKTPPIIYSIALQGESFSIPRPWGGGGVYSFVACLSHLTIDHASLSRRSTVCAWGTHLLLALVI